MKIDQILSENDLNELGATPMGFMSKAASTIGSKLGSVSSAAKLDVGKRANELYGQFRNWALRAGVDMSAVPVDMIEKWLSGPTQKFPAKFIDLGSPGTVYDLTKTGPNGTGVFTKISNKAWELGKQGTATPLSSKYGVTTPSQPGSKNKKLMPDDVLQKFASLSDADKKAIMDLIRNS